MRFIAIAISLLLIGFFPSQTASQTRSTDPGYQNHVYQNPGYQNPGNARHETASELAPRYVPGSSYEPAPSYRMTQPNRVVQASYEQPAAPPAPPKTTAKSDPTTGMKLGPGRSGKNKQQSSGNRGRISPLITIASSLVLVIGLFLIVAYLIRRAAPRANGALPADVVEVLGRAPLANRQQMHLLRCGNKLLLVSVTPNGAETLTEITDSDEVERLSALCRRTKPGGTTASFSQVFQRLSRTYEPADLPDATQNGATGQKGGTNE